MFNALSCSVNHDFYIPKFLFSFTSSLLQLCGQFVCVSGRGTNSKASNGGLGFFECQIVEGVIRDSM